MLIKLVCGIIYEQALLYTFIFTHSINTSAFIIHYINQPTSPQSKTFDNSIVTLHLGHQVSPQKNLVKIDKATRFGLFFVFLDLGSSKSL
jgi:hypothetical protein